MPVQKSRELIGRGDPGGEGGNERMARRTIQGQQAWCLSPLEWRL